MNTKFKHIKSDLPTHAISTKRKFPDIKNMTLIKHSTSDSELKL